MGEKNLRDLVMEHFQKYHFLAFRFAKLTCLAGFLLLSSAYGFAQSKPPQSMSGQAAAERRATLNLDATRANPLQLRNLLKKMPKGADLHNHLSGAVYAESWIRAAAEDSLCVNLASL